MTESEALNFINALPKGSYYKNLRFAISNGKAKNSEEFSSCPLVKRIKKGEITVTVLEWQNHSFEKENNESDETPCADNPYFSSKY